MRQKIMWCYCPTCGPARQRRWRFSSARIARSTQESTSSSYRASSPTVFHLRPATLPPFNGGAFPHVTIGDDVVAQHRLIIERYGIQRLELMLSWSMGAEQTYEWAVRFPDMVKRALPFAGTAKTTPHDFIFVRSHEDALKSDPGWNNGFYKHQSDVHVGLRRHAQIWSVMGLCQDFYNKEAWREAGYTSLEDFLHRF